MTEVWNKINWLLLPIQIQNRFNDKIKTLKYSDAQQVIVDNFTIQKQIINRIEGVSETYKLVIDFQSENQFSVEIYKLFTGKITEKHESVSPKAEEAEQNKEDVAQAS